MSELVKVLWATWDRLAKQARTYVEALNKQAWAYIGTRLANKLESTLECVVSGFGNI